MKVDPDQRPSTVRDQTMEFRKPPRTAPGRWSVRAAVLFLFLFAVNSAVLMQLQVRSAWLLAVLPFYGIAMLLCGLTAGILAGIAILRRGERSWVLWLVLLPGLWVLFMLLGEFLVPH
jgi:hypothetical protein